MHKALHPRVTLTEYMFLEKKGGGGLISIEDSVHTSIQGFVDFIEKCGERIITATRNNSENERSNRTEISRKQKCYEKQLYGRFKQLTSEIL